MSSTVVVAGAGQAGVQVAASLRQEGFDGRIVLVGAEEALPYQRPPLSKGYLAGKVDGERIWLRPHTFYERNEVDLVLGERIAAIDRPRRRVDLNSGSAIGYDHLVLALGARNRRLPGVEASLDGLLDLRTVTDADAIRERMSSARSAVIVGGGFVGLEVAAAAVDAGLEVTVVEAATRLMPRALSAPSAEFFASFHRGRGARLMLGTTVRRVLHDGRAVHGVHTDAGEDISADLVLVAIGIRPDSELAAAAGLSVDDGIVVDEYLRTSDADISAIGDCAMFPTPFATVPRVRLESVQNAMDQARCVAARLTGNARPYSAVPWFWSDQAAAKLQIAGLIAGYDRAVARGDLAAGRYSMFCFVGERLLGVESVGRPGDHMAARRLLAAGVSITPAQAADEGFDLKEYSKLATAVPSGQ